MATNKKQSSVKFRLFEKNGMIMITLQTIYKTKEESEFNQTELIEYYVATAPGNIEKILETLVSTINHISIEGNHLVTNYRKKDTFIIENYNQLKNHPSLQPFFKKIHRKLIQEEKKGEGSKQSCRNAKKVLGMAALMAGVSVAGVSSSTMAMVEEIPYNSYIDENSNTDFELEGFMEKKASDSNREYRRMIIEQEMQKDQNQKEENKNQSQNLKESKIKEIVIEKEQLPDKSKSNQQGKEKIQNSKKSQENQQEEDFLIDSEIEALARELINQEATEEEILAAAINVLGDDVAITESSPSEKVNYIDQYHLTEKEVDTIKATVQHEAGFNPEEVYAVASTVINRSESGGWYADGNPYKVITAPGQFQSYYAGYYKKYENGNYAEYTDEIVDAMLTGELQPLHNFESFRSGSSPKGVQFTPNGNKYR